MALDPRHPFETEAELVDRRNAEAEARARRWQDDVDRRRAAGVPDVRCALPPAMGGKFDPHEQAQGRQKRGRRGYA